MSKNSKFNKIKIKEILKELQKVKELQEEQVPVQEEHEVQVQVQEEQVPVQEEQVPVQEEHEVQEDQKCEHCNIITDLKDDINGSKICRDCESCPICMEFFNKSDEEVVKLGRFCEHKFCKTCIKSIPEVKCPLCRAEPDYFENNLPLTNLQEIDNYLTNFIKCTTSENYIISENMEGDNFIQYEECEEYANLNLELFPVFNKNLKCFMDACFKQNIGGFFIRYYDNIISQVNSLQKCGFVKVYKVTQIDKFKFME